jgi:hypothetical protein
VLINPALNEENEIVKRLIELELALAVGPAEVVYEGEVSVQNFTEF